MDRVTVPITITIPVGPYPANVRWLHEALGSIAEQGVLPDEVLIIDDGAHIEPIPGVRVWRTPWRSGVAHAFNYGVALARNDLVIMLGSDDRLLPDCVRACWAIWQQIGDPHGYYAMNVLYDDGHVQNDPCNAAMVHKALWNLSGGFPIESAIGACDTWLISKLWISDGRMGAVYHTGDEPLYWYRNHEETSTKVRAGWMGVVETARDLWLRRGE